MPPVIDYNKCVKCTTCAQICPLDVFRVQGKGADRTVVVRYPDECWHCRACVMECPKEAITITNFLAKIDYSKCVNCGLCATVCPRKLIVNLRAPKVEAPVTEEVKA